MQDLQDQIVAKLKQVIAVDLNDGNSTKIYEIDSLTRTLEAVYYINKDSKT
jgi:hypothetical protein